MLPTSPNHQSPTMGTPQKSKERAMDLGSVLLSPPEGKRTADDFSLTAGEPNPSDSSSYPQRFHNNENVLLAVAQTLPLSPPITPQTQTEDAIVADDGAAD